MYAKPIRLFALVVLLIFIMGMIAMLFTSYAKAQQKVYAIQTGWNCGKVIEWTYKPYVLDTLKPTTDTTILQKHK